jgi:hypothetical protein
MRPESGTAVTVQSQHVTPVFCPHSVAYDRAMTSAQLRRWRTDVLKATQEVAAKQLGMSVKGYEKLEQGERRIAPWIEKLVHYITRYGVIE